MNDLLPPLVARVRLPNFNELVLFVAAELEPESRACAHMDAGARQRHRQYHAMSALSNSRFKAAAINRWQQAQALKEGGHGG